MTPASGLTDTPAQFDETSKSEEDIGTQGTLTAAQFEKLHEAEIKDINQQLNLRPWMLLGTGLFLILETGLILGIVNRALSDGDMQSLQLVFSTLIGATLLQTWGVINIMVKFLFKDINYDGKEKRISTLMDKLRKK